MWHVILGDIGIGFATLAASAFVLVILGVVFLAKDEANGDNPFE